MEFFITQDGSTKVFQIKGRLEFGDYPNSRGLSEAFSEPGIETVKLDLSELEFIDSAGIGMLLSLNNTAKEKGVGLTCSGISGQVDEVFQAFKLDQVLTIE